MSDRYLLVYASRESVRDWVHRVSSPFNPSRKSRRIVAVDETVVKVNGHRSYVWSAIDVESKEILAVYASRGRSIPNALAFMRRVLKACEGKPLIIVDRGRWYIVEHTFNKVSMSFKETWIGIRTRDLR